MTSNILIGIGALILLALPWIGVDSYPLHMIIVILIFKPSGIFGSEVRGVLDK